MIVLYDHYRSTHIDDNTSEVDVKKHSRCIAFMILSRITFVDYSAGSARLIFFYGYFVILTVSTHTIGVVLLAFLYKEMCNVTQIGKARIQGPLYLLQIWTWSWIRYVNPDRYGVTLFANVIPDYHTRLHAPYGARWKADFSHTHVPKHRVRMFRDTLIGWTITSSIGMCTTMAILMSKQLSIPMITKSGDAFVHLFASTLWRCIYEIV